MTRAAWSVPLRYLVVLLLCVPTALAIRDGANRGWKRYYATMDRPSALGATLHPRRTDAEPRRKTCAALLAHATDARDREED